MRGVEVWSKGAHSSRQPCAINPLNSFIVTSLPTLSVECTDVKVLLFRQAVLRSESFITYHVVASDTSLDFTSHLPAFQTSYHAHSHSDPVSTDIFRFFVTSVNKSIGRAIVNLSRVAAHRRRTCYSDVIAPSGSALPNISISSFIQCQSRAWSYPP